MRIERWYWLIVFCIISTGIHLGLVYKSKRFYNLPPAPKQTEIEVALEPLSEPPAPKPVEPPKPKPEPKPKPPVGLTEKDLAALLNPRRDAKPTPEFVHPKAVGRVRIAAKEPLVTTNEKRPTAPNVDPGGVEKLKNETPITAGLPTGIRDAGEPKLQRMARNDLPGGGGSPAPGPVLGGKGGAKGPEAPPEDILFNGGGAGGMNLPRVAPRIGGGGGASILSVENPLAKEAIPEDKPGLGAGLGGGQGLGADKGVGVGRGAGIGTRLDGTVALGTLHAKPGVGIGAGVGKNIGTRPPGGGKGTGSELPGTGGTGIGYGRGSGIGVGNGTGQGVGDGGGSRVGRMRGIPFGDVAGLLRGDQDGGGGKGGGPGGPGRGGLFGAAPIKNGGAPVHIAYLMDVSGSMREYNKIGKAKEALKKALSELKPRDTFNIIVFWGRIDAFSDIMVQATVGNVEAANIYVDNLRIGDGTNLSAALDKAFTMEDLTHMFVMSDGEPNRGIMNPRIMRDHIKDMNESIKVKISTLALTDGRRFEGMEMLKAIAAENDGQYFPVNLGDMAEKVPEKP